MNIEDVMKEMAGAWKIVDYYFETSEGNKIYPWGEEPVGWFIVDEAGHMSAQIMQDDRPVMDQPPTEEQAAKAYHSYVGYFGKARIDLENSTLTTRVEGALNPEWVGIDQVRTFSFEGDRLVLKLQPTRIGKTEVQGTFFWEKV